MARPPVDCGVGALCRARRARAFFLAGLARTASGPVLAVVAGERDAEDLADDLELFSDDAHFLPAWETLPFEHVSPNVSTMAQRAAARHALITGGPGTVVVGSVRAVVQRVSPSPVDPIHLVVGAEVDLSALTQRLADMGYERTDRVESAASLRSEAGSSTCIRRKGGLRCESTCGVTRSRRSPRSRCSRSGRSVLAPR